MPANPTIKLLLVDDHPLFRQGVRAALSVYEEINVVAEAASAEEAIVWLERAIPSQEPTIVLVDLNLPEMSGLELTRLIRHQYPSIGVVMLSMHESDEQAFNALQAGAAAYRPKDIRPKDLVDILRRVARGEYVINDVVFEDPKVASRLLSQFRSMPRDLSDVPGSECTLFTPLSEREIEVLEQIASGGSNRDIAEGLGISTQTVKNHISSILRKLSLNDRTQAVLFALRRGWIETPDTILGGGPVDRSDNDDD
jgi:DNA-binding NarL/FixJ family response regulator